MNANGMTNPRTNPNFKLIAKIAFCDERVARGSKKSEEALKLVVLAE
jgi:hypothetical protein